MNSKEKPRIPRSIVVRLDIKAAILLIVAAVFFCATGGLVAEKLSMTTYYPSPVGVYKNLTATENAVLARDGGQVSVGTAANPANLSVEGSGTFSGPMTVQGDGNFSGAMNVQGAVNVDGMFRPAVLANDPTGTIAEGAMYFNSNSGQYRTYRGGSWHNIDTNDFPDYDSGWVSVGLGFEAKTFPHGFGTYPGRIEGYFSQTNPPSGPIYPINQYYVYNSLVFDRTNIYVHHWYYAYVMLDAQAMTWRIFNTGYYRVKAWR